MITVKVVNRADEVIETANAEKEVNLCFEHEYHDGDKIIVYTDNESKYLWMQLDEALGKSMVFVNGRVEYPVPCGEKKCSMSPRAFAGEKHLINIREAHKFELSTYRNLALNVNDQNGVENCYPHASANVETRGEAVFAARNAIDGLTANVFHGEWPYSSWGINRNPQAELVIDFGRMVCADRIIIYLRADFPHDSWWENAIVSFSDGTDKKLTFEKTGEGQEFTFKPKDIKWIKLHSLNKADDESPFPALTQIEVYGVEAIDN